MDIPTPDPRHMAKHIHLQRGRDGKISMWVDGELLPWFTSDGYDLHIKRDNIAGVTATIVAEKVTTEDIWLMDRESYYLRMADQVPASRCERTLNEHPRHIWANPDSGKEYACSGRGLTDEQLQDGRYAQGRSDESPA